MELDYALGVGGIPRGRIIEIYGTESSVKTTLALHVSHRRKAGGHSGLIDAEHALDPFMQKTSASKSIYLYVSQPEPAIRRSIIPKRSCAAAR